MIKVPSPASLRRGLLGRQIIDLWRRGKYLLLELSGQRTLILHLGMTGALYVKSIQAAKDEYARVVFHLDDGQELRFVDPRKFGRIFLVKDPQEVVGHLGPEPLAPDFSLPQFRSLLGRRKGMLKPLLLNQRFIAGLGNIYSDEALFQAGLHPQRPAATLSGEEVEHLYRAIREVLCQGLADGGSTLNDETYCRPNGGNGEHQERLLVFQREGQPCTRCGTPIRRMVLGGRGTYFCPRCQR
jgi:formamidopyrimidine-DNA glycosylase